MRFYDVNSGSISIDGVDIKNIHRDSLHSNFGMVLQDTWLFASTIRDNIAYGKPEATDEEIIAAAKAANAHRLSTIRESDIILVMDNGNVVESGTHDELLRKGNYYAKLYNSQFTFDFVLKTDLASFQNSF